MDSERRRVKQGHSPEKHHIDLFDLFVERVIFFRVLFVLDQFAELARVKAIERFRNRFGKSRIARIGNDHAGPSDGLKKAPMEAKRQ